MNSIKLQKHLRSAIFITLLGLSACSSSEIGNSAIGDGAAPIAGGQVPEQSKWEDQMRNYGNRHCAALKNSSLPFDPLLAATYYDAEWVFFQIGDYTGEKDWYDCAQAAEKVYRDQYVLKNKGQIPGYWVFSHGIISDYLRTGDAQSRKAAIDLASNAAFLADNTPLESTQSSEMSREVAYAVMTYLNLEDIGEPRRPRLEPLVQQIFGHFDQWFNNRSAPYVRPFMVGLSAHALIMYAERTGDQRVLPVLKGAADKMWDSMWLSGSQAFMYTDRVHASGGKDPSPDLNLLIAPMYAWLYKETGEARYAEQADEIFAGGVRQAYLENQKQFNQNYRWSFEYLRWRNGNNRIAMNR